MVRPLVRGRLLLSLLVFLGHVPAGKAVCEEVGHVFTVSPQVLPHVARLYESLLTDRADMVPLAGVRCRVSLPMRPLHEGLATIGAEKSFFPLWYCRWFWYADRDRNLFSHCGHLYLFSPVCRVMCNSCLALFVNPLPQKVHRTVSSTSVCLFTLWFLKADAVWYVASHVLHP